MRPAQITPVAEGNEPADDTIVPVWIIGVRQPMDRMQAEHNSKSIERFEPFYAARHEEHRVCAPRLIVVSGTRSSRPCRFWTKASCRRRSRVVTYPGGNTRL